MWRSIHRLALWVGGGLGAALIAVGPAEAATSTYSNATPITIPAGAPGTSDGPAAPYPSSINATGLSGEVFDVNATLHGFSHTFPADVAALLVGPSGRSSILMVNAGGGDPVTNLNLTFDDEAASQLPTPLISGTFKPSFGSEAFPPPAPSNPGGGLSNLNGEDPNGQYSLFVIDEAGGDVGSIAGGWSLEVAAFDTAITRGPKDRTKKKRATFEFNADGIQGATFECSLDGRRGPCTSPTTVRVKPGKHIFEVKGTVEGVTDSTPATDEWKVKKKKKKKGKRKGK
jgi:hypothetical protein